MTNLMGIVIFILASFLTSLGHIFLKKGLTYKDGYNFYLNKNTIIAGSIFISVTLLTITGYKFIDLKYGIILSTTSYFFVVLLSKIILKEFISYRSKIGSIFILLGILIFSIN